MKDIFACTWFKMTLAAEWVLTYHIWYDALIVMSFSAVYCVDCFADLKNICAVCSNVVEYKGSDESDEQ